ncbi:hypothetical protein M8C21_021497, partial [Ambrosia artemisiifolia]
CYDVQRDVGQSADGGLKNINSKACEIEEVAQQPGDNEGQTFGDLPNSSMNMAQSSSFSRAIYSEIEEIGWEHLVKLAKDLSFVTFHVV